MNKSGIMFLLAAVTIIFFAVEINGAESKEIRASIVRDTIEFEEVEVEQTPDSTVINVEVDSVTVLTEENKDPEISYVKLITMDESATLRSLLAKDGFSITIKDDSPGQLEVFIKKGRRNYVKLKRDPGKSNTFLARLIYPNSEDAYDLYTGSRESPYSIPFTIFVRDKISERIVAKKTLKYVFGDY